MMEKVKVTQEQAELIEYALSNNEGCYDGDKDRLLNGVLAPHIRYHNRLCDLNDIDVVLLAKALYIGYEVIPEFKKGDWCYNTVNDLCCQITKINGIEVWGDWYGDGSKTWSFKDSIRHATEEEIAEEKERRVIERLKGILDDLPIYEQTYLYDILHLRLNQRKDVK